MAAIKSSLTSEMEHVTMEMYKKNFELAERNKTLLLLRKIEELILSSITDINVVAQKVTEIVVHDGGLKSVSLRVMNHSRTALIPLSVSFANTKTSLQKKCVELLSSANVSLLKDEHTIAKAVKTKKMQRTSNLYFLPCTGLDIMECRTVQKSYGIKEFLVYPLIMRDHVIGAMTVGVGSDDEFSYDQQKDLLDRLPNIVSIALDNSLLYQAIAKANDRLKELDKLKDDFVSIASHELRTPMTAIKSYIWMLINKNEIEYDAKTKEYLDITYTSTERLIKLVANMLTVSRIEGKRLELILTKLDLKEMIRNVFSEVAIKAHEGKIKLMLEAPTKPIYVMGDKDKLHEVVMNLLGNSLKFTPEGGDVIVRIKKNSNSVDISVIDTGPGMSKEDQSKLFQKFGMLGNSYAKAHNASGTGLGLFIVKQIVKLHKGHISVESTLGKGSTFTFTLPL